MLDFMSEHLNESSDMLALKSGITVEDMGLDDEVARILGI